MKENIVHGEYINSEMRTAYLCYQTKKDFLFSLIVQHRACKKKMNKIIHYEKILMIFL